jgi:hypothetical protein
MKPLPTTDERSNLGTWAIPCTQVPALAQAMCEALPPEDYDPNFKGQDLETCYFDTQSLDLWSARCKGDQYLTLRLRCYPGDVYALSAKTESEKFRVEIPSEQAEMILEGDWPNWTDSLLPANLQTRLWMLAVGEPLCVAVCICCTRYARESKSDRLTLDVGVHTDRGKCLPYGVLEYKSTDLEATTPPGRLGRLGLRPLKLSKFKWSLGA